MLKVELELELTTYASRRRGLSCCYFVCSAYARSVGDS